MLWVPLTSLDAVKHVRFGSEAASKWLAVWLRAPFSDEPNACGLGAPEALAVQMLDHRSSFLPSFEVHISKAVGNAS